MRRLQCSARRARTSGAAPALARGAAARLFSLAESRAAFCAAPPSPVGLKKLLMPRCFGSTGFGSVPMMYGYEK